MIAHFVEVWALLVVTFLLGCAIGALGYELLAQSAMASAQLRIVDAVGDVVDRLKKRLGINPAWREYRHIPIQPEPDKRAPVSDAVFVEAVAAGLEEHAAQSQSNLDQTPAQAPKPEVEQAGGGSESTTAKPSLPPLPQRDEHLLADIESLVPMRAAGLNRPRKGVPDNLQKIRGIGKKNEKLLNQLGIYHFGQIAAWTPGEILWVGQYLAFPERIVRDDWIGQAVVLASGGDTGLTKSADRRRNRRISAGANDGIADETSDSGDDDSV